MWEPQVDYSVGPGRALGVCSQDTSCEQLADYDGAGQGTESHKEEGPLC